MGKQVVIVGRLLALSRAEAERAIVQAGNSLSDHVTADTSLVVLGGRGPHFQPSGRPHVQLARARRLLQQGILITVCREDEWLAMIGIATPGVRQTYTAAQMAEALGVTRGQIERWATAGLLQPVDASFGIPLFDFQQVSAARTIADLSRQGVRLAKVKHAVGQLARWLPETQRSLISLTIHEDARRLVVRTEAGLAEPSGQLLFDFDVETEVSTVDFSKGEDQAELFHRAVAMEEAHPTEAADLYRRCLREHGPHPTVAFNLGNALYAADDVAGALEYYRLATDLEPAHSGAWNNLANVLAELDQLEEALNAYRRALSLDRRLLDARFNLAQTLVELGRQEEAVLHWRAYLAADSDSNWADFARDCLARM